MGGKNECFLFEGEFSKAKYQSKNPLAKMLINGFMTSLLSLAKRSGSQRFLEVGCGEGQICGLLAKNGFNVRGFDISVDAIEVATRAAEKRSLDILFTRKNLFDTDAEHDREQTIICCEVLEHMEDPGLALRKILAIAKKTLF